MVLLVSKPEWYDNTAESKYGYDVIGCNTYRVKACREHHANI